MDPKTNKLLLPLLFIGVLMGAVDLAIIGPALPAIQAEFAMDSRELAVLFNAYVLCQLIGTPLLAKLSDRFGPRAIYISSLTCFAVGSLILIVAPDKGTLFLGRAVQGFGAGGIFPVAAAVIGTSLPEKERGPALGILGVVFGLAFLIGPILGGILLRYSWHWLFLINLPIAALLIAGAVKLLPSAPSAKKTPFDLAGTATLIVMLIALVGLLNQLDAQALVASLTTWPMLLTSALLLITVPLFWRLESRASDPIIQPAFFRSRQIVRTCLIGTGVGAIQAGSVFAPALAVAMLDIEAATAAWLMLPGVVVATAASPIAGRLINDFGTRSIVIVSLALVATSLAIYGLAHLSIATFILAGCISGAGMSGVLGAPLRFILLAEAEPQDRASAQGLLSAFTSIGRLAGAAIAGSIAASYGGGAPGYQAAFVAMALLALLLLGCALTLKSRNAEQVQDNAAQESAA